MALSTKLSPSTPQNPRFWVILVHFGDAKPTLQALSSLLHGTLPPHRIVIIDHALHPLFLAAASNHHMRLIRPQRNEGFAAGVNVGLGFFASAGAQGHDVIIVMNNDVTVYPDTLATLRAWWQEYCPTGIVGVERRAINLFTGRTTLMANHWWHLPYIPGYFFAGSLGTLLHLKGLPEQYFLYWEDVLLSMRARRAGFTLDQAQGVQVVHPAHDTVTAERTYYLIRSGARFMAEESPWPWRWLWWGVNRLREAAHRGVVRQALRDARHQRGGKKP